VRLILGWVVVGCDAWSLSTIHFLIILIFVQKTTHPKKSFKKIPKMFKMTMAKFLRPAVATPTKTHDEKILTLSEAQTKQIRQQNLRTLNSFINTNMGTPIDQRCKKQMRFAYSEIPARFEVPSDNCEMLCITCVLLTLDSFDRPAMLRRKCRRMNAKISGAVVRMND
jgi:hypothetical protein